MKSEVESMWEAMNTKFGTNRAWSTLHPMEQHSVIAAINQLLSILHKG